MILNGYEEKPLSKCKTYFLDANSVTGEETWVYYFEPIK